MQHAAAALDEQGYDLLRAENYALLGTLLAAPPGAELLQRLASMQPEGTPDSPLDRAWRELAAAAGAADPVAVADEYQALFIGIGRGELLPYGSWYQTGFLMERPLTVLRSDLAVLGFARADNVSEPEDHVAALCEVLAMLIADPERAVGHDRQHAFFVTHVAPFFARFWVDLEAAESADFYRAVARLGAAFTRLEQDYFSLPA